MSLRDELKALSLSDEQVDSVEVLFRKQISGEYIPKSRFDEVNTKSKELAKDVIRLESEKETLSKQAKEAQDALSPLKSEFEAYKAEQEKKFTELEQNYEQREADRAMLSEFEAKQNAIKSCLGDSAHDIDLISSFIDFDSLSFDGSTVSGVQEAVAAVKKEKPFLFKEVALESTAPRSAPNQGQAIQGGDFGKSLAEKASAIDAITKAAEQKYFGG